MERGPVAAADGRGRVRRLRAWTARMARRRRLVRHSRAFARQVVATLGLVALSALVALAMVTSPTWVPSGTMVLVLLLGVFVLPPVAMVLVGVVATGLLAWLAVLGRGDVQPGAVVLTGVAAVFACLFVLGRARRGLQGAASDLMLVDLRDRLVAHGRIPALPPGWRVDSLVRSAYAEAFSGDFVVASTGEQGRLLEIVLVDVSGKGQEAGVRSLLLSGAFGGLLGAMPREEFLPAANAYLLEQAWSEGFATAVHVAVRLDTGDFWVSTAGHPPAIHLHAGSGLIERLDTSGGPALGVVPDPVFRVHQGVLEPGDTLMLYTDGLVETPGGDVDLGIDRLMGEAERVVATRRGGAESVLAGIAAGEGDDRALILVSRD